VERGSIVDPAACAALVRDLLRESRLHVPERAPIFVNVPVSARRPDLVRLRSAVNAAFLGHPLELVASVEAVATFVAERFGDVDVVVTDVGYGLTEGALVLDGHIEATGWAAVGTVDLAGDRGADPGSRRRAAAEVAAVTDLVLAAAGDRRRDLVAVLTGGGALQPGLRELLAAEAQLDVVAPADADQATLLGLASIMRRSTAG
jgi:hypothetical protein